MKKLIPFILIINFYSCKAPEPAKEEPRIPTIVSEDIVIFKENESYRFSLVTKMPDPQYSSDRLNPEKYSQGQLHFYCQDNCPKFVKVDESTGDVNLMPTNNDAGIYKINFIVKSEIYQAEKAIFFLIKDVDRLPYFSETPIVKIKENEKLEYKLAASDPDYDKVYYRCKFCVESMYVVDDVLQYSPSFEDSGNKKIRIESFSRPEIRDIVYFPAKDEGVLGSLKSLLVNYSPESFLKFLLDRQYLTSDASFFDENLVIDRSSYQYYSFDINVEVENVDRAPVFRNRFDSNISIFEGQKSRITLDVFDPDGDSIDLICVDCPSGLSIENKDIIYSPSYDVAEAMGHKTVSAKIKTFNPDQNLLSSEVSIIFIVGDSNRPPYFINRTKIMAIEGEESRYSLSGKDDDLGDVIKYSKVTEKVCDISLPDSIKSNEANFCDCYVKVDENLGEVSIQKPPFSIARKSDIDSSKTRYCSFKITDKFGDSKEESYEISVKNKNVPPKIDFLKVLQPSTNPATIYNSTKNSENNYMLESTIVGGIRFIGEFNITDEDPEDIGKISISCSTSADSSFLCPEGLILGTLSNDYSKSLSPIGNKIKWTPPYNSSDSPKEYLAKISVSDKDGGESFLTIKFSVIKRDLPPSFSSANPQIIFFEGEQPSCPKVTENEIGFTYNEETPSKNCIPILASDPENDPMTYSLVSLKKDGTEYLLPGVEDSEGWIDFCKPDTGGSRPTICSQILFENETIRLHKKYGILTFRPSYLISSINDTNYEKVLKLKIKISSKSPLENSSEFSAFKDFDIKVRNFNNKVVIDSVDPKFSQVIVKENLGATDTSDLKEALPTFTVKASDIDFDSINFGCEYVPIGIVPNDVQPCPDFIKMLFKSSTANQDMENGKLIVNIEPNFNTLVYNKNINPYKIEDLTFGHIIFYAYDIPSERVYINQDNPLTITVKNTNRKPKIVNNLSPDIKNIVLCENGQELLKDSSGAPILPYRCIDGNPPSPLVIDTLKAMDDDSNETASLLYGCEISGFISCEDAGLKIDQKTAKISLLFGYNMVNSIDLTKTFEFKIFAIDPLGGKTYFDSFMPTAVNTNRLPKIKILRTYLGENNYSSEKSSFFPICDFDKNLKRDSNGNFIFPYECEDSTRDVKLKEKIFRVCENGHRKLDSNKIEDDSYGVCDEVSISDRGLYFDLLVDDEDGDDVTINIKSNNNQNSDLPDSVFVTSENGGKTRVRYPKKSSFNIVAYKGGKSTTESRTSFVKTFIYKPDFDEAYNDECYAKINKDVAYYKKGAIIDNNLALSEYSSTCFTNSFKFIVSDGSDNTETIVKTIVENTDRRPRFMKRKDGSSSIVETNDSIILPEIMSCEGLSVSNNLGADFNSCGFSDKYCTNLSSLETEINSLSCGNLDEGNCLKTPGCGYSVAGGCFSLSISEPFRIQRAKICNETKKRNIQKLSSLGIVFETSDGSAYKMINEKTGKSTNIDKLTFLNYSYGKRISLKDFFYDEDMTLDGTLDEDITLNTNQTPSISIPDDKYNFIKAAPDFVTDNIFNRYLYNQGFSGVVKPIIYFYKEIDKGIFFAPDFNSAFPKNKKSIVNFYISMLSKKVSLGYRPINIDRPIDVNNIGNDILINGINEEVGTYNPLSLFNSDDPDSDGLDKTLIKCKKARNTLDDNDISSLIDDIPQKPCGDDIFNYDDKKTVISINCEGECPNKIIYDIDSKKENSQLINRIYPQFKINTTYSSAKRISSNPYRFRFNVSSYQTDFYMGSKDDEICSSSETDSDLFVDLIPGACDYPPLDNQTSYFSTKIDNIDRPPYTNINGYYPFYSKKESDNSLTIERLPVADGHISSSIDFINKYVNNAEQELNFDNMNSIIPMREPCDISNDGDSFKEDCTRFFAGSMNDYEGIDRKTRFPTKIAIKLEAYDVDKYVDGQDNTANIDKSKNSIFNIDNVSNSWKKWFSDTEELPTFEANDVICKKFSKVNQTYSVVSCGDLISFIKLDDGIDYALIDLNKDSILGATDRWNTAGTYSIEISPKGCPKLTETDWPCAMYRNTVKLNLDIKNIDRKPNKPDLNISSGDFIGSFSAASENTNNNIETYSYNNRITDDSIPYFTFNDKSSSIEQKNEMREKLFDENSPCYGGSPYKGNCPSIGVNSLSLKKSTKPEYDYDLTITENDFLKMYMKNNLIDEDNDSVLLCYSSDFKTGTSYRLSGDNNMFVRSLQEYDYKAGQGAETLTRTQTSQVFPVYIRACSKPDREFSYDKFSVCTSSNITDYCSEPLKLGVTILNSDKKPDFFLDNTESIQRILMADNGVYRSYKISDDISKIIKEGEDYSFNGLFKVKDNDMSDKDSLVVCFKTDSTNDDVNITIGNNKLDSRKYANDFMCYQPESNGVVNFIEKIKFSYNFTNRREISRDFNIDYKVCYKDLSNDDGDMSSLGYSCGIKNEAGLWVYDGIGKITLTVYNNDQPPAITCRVDESMKNRDQSKITTANRKDLSGIRSLYIINLKLGYCEEYFDSSDPGNSMCEIMCSITDKDTYDGGKVSLSLEGWHVVKIGENEFKLGRIIDYDYIKHPLINFDYTKDTLGGPIRQETKIIKSYYTDGYTDNASGINSRVTTNSFGLNIVDVDRPPTLNGPVKYFIPGMLYAGYVEGTWVQNENYFNWKSDLKGSPLKVGKQYDNKISLKEIKNEKIVNERYTQGDSSVYIDNASDGKTISDYFNVPGIDSLLDNIKYRIKYNYDSYGFDYNSTGDIYMTNSSDIKAVFTDKLFTDPDGDKAFNLKISFIPSRFVIREYWMPGGNNGFTSYSDLTRYNDEYFYNNTNQTQWFQADYFYEVSTFPGDPVGKNFETSINLDIGSTNKECATRDWNSTVQYAQYEKTDEQYSYYGETNFNKKIGNVPLTYSNGFGGFPYYWADGCCLAKGTCKPIPGLNVGEHTNQQYGANGDTWFYCSDMFKNFSLAQRFVNDKLSWEWGGYAKCVRSDYEFPYGENYGGKNVAATRDFHCENAFDSDGGFIGYPKSSCNNGNTCGYYTDYSPSRSDLKGQCYLYITSGSFY